MYSEYNDDVQFLMIYIREAHPVDGWWFGDGLAMKLMKKFAPEVSMDAIDPKTITERREIARQCEEALEYDVRTYVDDMDDTVSKAYAAKPTRLYLVGKDGRVVYAGGQGPCGFKPGELGTAIQRYLER